MDSKLLRRACEAARLRVIPWGDNWAVMVREDRFMNPGHPVEREWIESRCASLLVATVQRVSKRADYLCNLQDIVSWPLSFATDEQRIRAAMEVLSDD